jgi:hypothetical protein
MVDGPALRPDALVLRAIPCDMTAAVVAAAQQDLVPVLTDGAFWISHVDRAAALTADYKCAAGQDLCNSQRNFYKILMKLSAG